MGRKNSRKRRQSNQFDAKALFRVFKNDTSRFFRKKQLLKYLPKGVPERELLFALDRLVKEGKIYKTPDKKYRFSQKHYEKQQAVVQGIVDLSASGTAYVIVEGMDEDIMVERSNTKGSLQDDLVEVAITKVGKRRVKGVILRIVKRSTHTFPGIIQIQSKSIFVVPDRKNIPYDIFIPKGNALNAQDGDKVIVTITKYDERMKSPEGKVVSVLGKPGEHEVEMASILLDHGIEYDFPKEVMDELALVEDEISEKEIRARHDVRDVLTFTIDPHDAKDFDDALSFRELENGNYEVG